VEIVPRYLRFLRGLVDSADLPLNVSREMIQESPLLAAIKRGVTSRILSELEKLADSDAAAYHKIWDTFGAVLKEGLYEDSSQRETLLDIARFKSTGGEALTGLADYVKHMPEGQTAIYYITGDDAEAVRRSPHLEGFRAKGVEVLLLSDPVDEFWIPSVIEFQGKPFKSVTRGGADLSGIAAKTDGDDKTEKDDKKTPEVPAGTDALIAYLKLALKDAVKDVRPSERLTDSPVCLIADEGDMDMHLERLLKQHRQIDMASKRVLEINAGHSLIRSLAERLETKGASGGKDANSALDDAAWLLLDQARILEGEALSDPAAFARRLSAVVERGFRV